MKKFIFMMLVALLGFVATSLTSCHRTQDETCDITQGPDDVVFEGLGDYDSYYSEFAHSVYVDSVFLTIRPEIAHYIISQALKEDSYITKTELVDKYLAKKESYDMAKIIYLDAYRGRDRSDKVESKLTDDDSLNVD